MVRISKRILLICLIFFYTNCAFTNPGDPTIISVSTSLDTVVSATGSLEGGTMLYIKGTNFDPIATNNVITVGPYPCILSADGANVNNLACTTTAPTNPNQITALPITVTVGTVFVSCNSNNCRFSYSSSKTPFIEQIIPRSVIGSDPIYVYGTHRITNLGDGRSPSDTDIDYLTIGNHLCSMIDVVQNQDAFNANYRSSIQCLSDVNQIAGEYDFTELVTPGLARHSLRTLQTSYFTGQNYTQRVLANIKSMSSHQGGSKGHLLTVQGTGFSPNPSDYQCTISGETCQVIEAGLTQITVKVPEQSVGNTAFGALAKDVGDSSSQVDPFLDSHGLKYRRYNREGLYKSGPQWLTYLRGTPTIQLQSEKIITELSSPQEYGQNYVQYVRGYFHAPLDGVYKFSGLADDLLYMQLATIPNNANPANLQMLLLQQKYNTNHYVTYVRDNSTQSTKQMTLTAGYYYLQLVCANTGGTGYFKVMVDMPSTHANTINPVWQIDRIKIKPAQYDAQVIEVKVFGQSGSFDIFYYDSTNYLYKAIIDIGSSASTFAYQLGNLPNLYNYGPRITMQKLDVAGAPTANPALVEGYLYTLTFDFYRPPTDLPYSRVTNVVSSANIPASINIERKTPHSPPLSGTFTLSVGGTPLQINNSPNIPYNADSSQIQYALNTFYNTRQIRVSRVIGTTSTDSIEFVIQYVGLASAPQTLTISLILLQGGTTGTNPVSTVETLRAFSSTRELYSPIPYDFLYIPSSKPALKLSINSIPAACQDCSYEIKAAATPVLSFSSRSGSSLILTLTDPQSTGYALSSVTVTFLGVNCLSLTGSISSFTCTFPTNPDSSVGLPAGSGIPVVHVVPLGYADTSSITADVIPILVTSFTPAETAPGGGIEATIIGSGLPIGVSTGLSIQVCGNEATQFTQLTNQQIKFIIPREVTACTGSNNVITVNGQSTTFTFSYNPAIAPQITSLSPTSSSPVMKSTITITGSNFSTKPNTEVYLVQNGEKKYQLNIISMTSSSIQCVLGGGKSGEYDVIVYDLSNGMSVLSANSKFNYKIVITSLSLSTGQRGGGYNLTVTGYNFAPTAGTNNVFIGDSKNSLCTVLSSTATSIVCRMPRMMDDYTVGQSLDVVVTGRILEESLCEGTCTFSYTDQGSNITVPSVTNYKAGEIVSVVGQGLSGATVTINDIECNVTSTNDTNIDFVYPPVPAGSYEVFIKVASGWTYPQFISTTKLSFESVNANGGSYAGMEFVVTGNGYPSLSNVAAWFVCSSTTPLTLLSGTPTKISILIPPFSGDTICKVNLTIGTSFTLPQYTYRANSTCSINITGSGTSYTLTKNNMTSYSINKVQFILLDSNGNPTSSKYPMTVSGNTISTSYLPAGTFKVSVHSNSYGYAVVEPATVIVAFPSNPTASAITSSFAGGKALTINGAGFVTNDPKNNEISVCGLRAKVVSASQTAAIISVPPLVTLTTQTTYSLASVGQITGTYFGDANTALNVGDNSFNTLYSSPNTTCWVGIDFGTLGIADVDTIKYVPNPQWAIAATKLDGAVFQGSNDGTTYTTITIVDTNQVHSGWNIWQKNPSDTFRYRYIRFKHTNASACQLAQIQVFGILYANVNVQNGVDHTCDVVVKTGNKVISNAVTYSHAATSVVIAVSPAFAPSIGGDTLTITGTGFGTTVTVTIDGIDCSITTKSATQIVCTTGRRATPPSSGNTFIVNSDGNYAKIATDPFLYIDRWSSEETWGGQAVPREGDSVYVPVGMTLLVDQSTPVLNTIIVQGKIQFEDKDLTFDAHYFLINGGQFQAGTQTNRFLSKLTITLHGGYYDKQLPIFGNKVLGCLNCKFNMHGKERTKTWTQVQSTISPGDTSFRVIEAVDWVAGEKIAVASTSFDHYETEEMEISAVSPDGFQITVTKPFKYKHFAAVQTYGTTDFVMRAEVGLLTRNIVVKGDDTSDADEYGSHLMFNGRQSKGLQGRVSYVQFTKCGQPKIVGRYCTHFHMAGQVPNSYIRGIAVHHSFARVLTIHGTHFMLIEKSVGYYVKGHNIFVEDGIETNNVIQDNLMMNSIASNIMLQSDITVASYWITNPYNTVRRNHAAGGDFYGFWYEIKENPDGPSATSDICPMGMQLGISQDNVAHSNRRFGLRIFKLSARKYPCIDTQDESALDPYVGNPAIQSVFKNYTLWKNEECGFLGEELGYTTITDFRTIDSRKGGMQFHKTNFTKELVIAKNSVVVGYSSGNAPTDIDTDYNNARGVIASRTDGLKFSGIQFYNFGATMTPLQSCSECYHFKLWVTGGKTTYFENITYTNILGNYIFWQKWRREIFIDLDGTMTLPFKNAITPAISAQSSATITPYRPSLMIPNHCYTVPNDKWNNSIYCDHTVTLRGILFTNAIPSIDFNAINITVHLLDSPTDNITSQVDSQFSFEPMIIIKKSMDIKNSWAMPFATGQYYNVHWKQGLDFTHVAIAPSRLWNNSDGTVLRFNYTDNRQLFQIGKWYQQKLQAPFITASNSLIDPATCSNGDYYHDPDNRYLYVCVSGRNKTIRQWIDVNGIRCLNFCPAENPPTERENFMRLWSNVSQWPGQVLPGSGQNVTIPYEWNLVLDIDPPVFNYVKINGILIFDRSRDNKFEANYIWVNQGIIRIGSQDNPFTNKANIILHGSKTSKYLVIDPNASGNKMLAVTGGLEFYGVEPQTTWTRLTQTALAGATKINVASAAGWSVGDSIVIAPSYAGRKQFEEVKITAINGKEITFTPALTYEHYGASTTTIANDYGVLDTRSAVGILTRNIKITGANDTDDWGCRVLVYGYNEIPEDLLKQPVWRNGYVKFRGVEIDKCGQRDTTLAALRFENLGIKGNASNSILSEVENSAIHGCGAFCAFIKQVSNVSINNNVFFYARKFLVYVEQVNGQYNFTSNLLIGARKRDQITGLDQTMMVDDVAAYEQYFPIDFAGNIGVNVSNNLVQGSEGEGFVFPATTCNLIDSYPFYNNTAGSCQVAFMYEKLDGKTCLAARSCIGYASEIGLMANMPGDHIKMQYSNMFFADNQRGVTLRYAHQIDQNSLIFKNSYVTGISRPTCTTCYGASKISYCHGGYAVRMFTTTITGETFPLKKAPTGHDVICTQEAFDAKAFLNNVTFENYWTNNPQIPYCSNMFVFKRHNLASDATAGHYLTNTKCVNCDQSAWAYFDEPNTAWRGWFGGCGNLDCTGPNNYIIHDQDGSFTGQKSQILANNTMIGNYEASCQNKPQWNGHWCKTEELAILQYQSIAPDFNKRIMWPVYLKYDGGPWNSTTNGWREWQWDGPEPMNLRLARFWSVIKLHQSYNLTYSSQPPSDSRFQIQKRLLPSGNSADWAIIRIYYPLPNSIEVRVKNSTGQDILVKPYPIKKGVAEDLKTKTSICGANNFYYESGTIQFVVNGIENCQVRVRLSSYIQLSTRLDIPFSSFYTNNSITSFIQNICAFLGIDEGRMKIVSIRQGSTIIDSVIQTSGTSLDNSTTTASNPAAEYAELNLLQQKLKSGLTNGLIHLGGPLLSYSADTYIFNGDGTQFQMKQQALKQNKILVIILATVIPVVIALGIVAGYCYWRRKRAQIHEASPLHNQSSIQRQNIKGTTEIEMSSAVAVEDFPPKYNKKWEQN